MRTITLPLHGETISERDGVIKGSDSAPLEWTPIHEIARLRGITVPRLRYRMKLVSYDLDAATVTVQIRGETDDDTAIDSLVDELERLPTRTPEQVRQLLKDDELDSRKRARFDLKRTGKV